MQNMKQKIYHIIIFLLFWFCGVAYSQNPKADILQQDLSGLFDNLSMIGILGEDCSRIDIHITEVRKMDSREYEIKGISRTRLSVICPFKGKVCVDSISSCSQMIKVNIRNWTVSYTGITRLRNTEINDIAVHSPVLSSRGIG